MAFDIEFKKPPHTRRQVGEIDARGVCRLSPRSLDLTFSRPAERAPHDLLGARRLGVALAAGLIVEGPREDRDQLLEGLEILARTAATIASSTRWLRGMNAGLERRMAWRRARVAAFLIEPAAPAARPVREHGRIGEQRGDLGIGAGIGCSIGQRAERQREIGLARASCDRADRGPASRSPSCASVKPELGAGARAAKAASNRPGKASSAALRDLAGARHPRHSPAAAAGSRRGVPGSTARSAAGWRRRSALADRSS